MNTITIEHAHQCIDIMDWCKTHRVPWNPSGRCWTNYYADTEKECLKAKVILVEVDPELAGDEEKP